MPPALRILVVEDEWLIAQDHVDRIRKAGHEVVGPVASVEKAVSRLERDRVDLALLDIRLNGETTYDLADTLLDRAIPFAFLTGYSRADIPARFRHIQVLQKPVAPIEMNDVIASLSGSGPQRHFS
jgi:two-component SAPR family response regulator